MEGGKKHGKRKEEGRRQVEEKMKEGRKVKGKLI